MPAGIDLTREKAAEFFGVDLRTIDAWLRNGAPGQKLGRTWRINSAELSGWLRQRERDQVLGEVSRVTEAEARRKKLVAEAISAGVKAAIDAGAVVAIADFERQLAAMIGRARAKALQLGSKLAPLVVTARSPAEAKDLIDGAIHELLAELSRDVPVSDATDSATESASGQPESGEVVGAAAGPDNQRVGRPAPPAKRRKQRRARPVVHKPR